MIRGATNKLNIVLFCNVTNSVQLPCCRFGRIASPEAVWGRELFLDYWSSHCVQCARDRGKVALTRKSFSIPVKCLLTFSDWLSRKWWKCGSSFTGYNGRELNWKLFSKETHWPESRLICNWLKWHGGRCNYTVKDLMTCILENQVFSHKLISVT